MGIVRFGIGLKFERSYSATLLRLSVKSHYLRYKCYQITETRMNARRVQRKIVGSYRPGCVFRRASVDATASYDFSKI